MAAYACAVDRLDWWLNAQRGWRREALWWLNFAPLTIMLCAITWSWFGLTGWIAVPVALAVLVRLAGRDPMARKRSGRAWTPPAFSWRRLIAILLISAAQTSNAFFDAQDGTPTWQHWHRINDAANLIACLGYITAVIAEWVYLRRLSRQAAAEA